MWLGPVLAALALALGGPAAASQVDFPEDGGAITFNTPSGNIGCIFIPAGGTATYEPLDGGPELQCDRVAPGYVRAILGPRGPARILKDVGDASCCSTAPVLAYGQTWSKAGFTCTSSAAGLTCKRGQAGFTLSRKAATAR